MKKDKLIEIAIGTIGGLTFSFGMCITLVPEWNLFNVGVMVAIFGFIILLCIIPFYHKSHPKKEHAPVSWRIVLTWATGFIGALIMGFGMSRFMIKEASISDMIVGIIISALGLLICILNYPIYSYLKTIKINNQNN